MANTFSATFEVRDISGNPITTLLDSDFSKIFRMNAAPVSGATVTVVHDISGRYFATATPLPLGYGFLSVKPNNNAYTVSPDFYDLKNESNRTTDEIYNLVYSQTITSIPYDTSSRYGIVTLKQKEGDDFREIVSVPKRFLPLTGWTNLSIKAYPQSRTTSSAVPALSGSYSATVTDATNGYIEIYVSRDVFSNVIPNGSNTTTIYSDLQGYNISGDRKTLAEIRFAMERDFNS